MSWNAGFRDLGELKNKSDDFFGQVNGWMQERWDHTRRAGRILVQRVNKGHQIQQIQQSTKRREALERNLQFWTRSVHIYTSYKVCQMRAGLAKDPEKEKLIWEAQHEYAADRLYSLCVDLGGFFLKSGQFLAKPDLVPMAWVKRLSVLHDAAPEDPYPVVQATIKAELGCPLESVFSSFSERPVGSASIAQVHRATLRSSGEAVAVKVQHPNAESLVMMDLQNHKVFANFLQKFELPFDLLSIVNELEAQVKHEFDFEREARSMTRIANSMARNRKGDKTKPPVIVPRPISGMVTRRVLVMDFIDGVQITRLGEEMKKKGINPTGRLATIARRNILRDLSLAYGHMILRDGHFQADPHPGNILVCKGGKVALLDYGQTKEIPKSLRLRFAQLVLAICNDDADRIGSLYSELGIVTAKNAQQEPDSFRRMACMMFDTRSDSIYTTTNPFAEESSLKSNAVHEFPKDLFFILRTAQLLRGLSKGMNINWTLSEHWKPIAMEVLAAANQ